MALALSEKVVVVVGGSSGMGKETARQFVAQGARVVITSRRQAALMDAKAQIAPNDDRLTYEVMDARDRASVFEVFEKIHADLNRIDILAYAAGINLKERAIDVLSPEGWQDLLDTNVTGAFHCTQAVLPVMRAQNDGLMIYLSSVAAKRADRSGVAYQTSKRGMDGLAGGVMEELRTEGIRTSVVYPGLCNTPLLDARPVPPTQEERERALQPEDVAAACLFIATLPARAHVPELVLVPSNV